MKKTYWVIAFIVILVILILAQKWQVSRIESSLTEPATQSTTTPELQSASTTVSNYSAPIMPSVKPSKNFMHTVTIETTMGTIVFETYDADAPLTVENFINLAGKGFYDGVIFHRVIPGFMIQGGDPTGTGMGGPGYKFADELDPGTASAKEGYVRGTVAMANAGPNTNGSQFFIMHKDYPLPHSYTIFGKVISGMDVVDKIAATKTGPGDKPVTPVVMNKVTVAESK